MWDLHNKMKLLQPPQLQSTNNPKHESLHDINKKMKTARQIWKTYTGKLAYKKSEDVMVSKKHQET